MFFFLPPPYAFRCNTYTTRRYPTHVLDLLHTWIFPHARGRSYPVVKHKEAQEVGWLQNIEEKITTHDNRNQERRIKIMMAHVGTDPRRRRRRPTHTVLPFAASHIRLGLGDVGKFGKSQGTRKLQINRQDSERETCIEWDFPGLRKRNGELARDFHPLFLFRHEREWRGLVLLRSEVQKFAA